MAVFSMVCGLASSLMKSRRSKITLLLSSGRRATSLNSSLELSPSRPLPRPRRVAISIHASLPYASARVCVRWCVCVCGGACACAVVRVRVRVRASY
jgi:hypothetical protein